MIIVLILSMTAFSIGIISLLTIKMGKQKTFQILFKSAPPKTFTSSHGYLLTTSLLPPSPPPQKKELWRKLFLPTKTTDRTNDRSNEWYSFITTFCLNIYFFSMGLFCPTDTSISKSFWGRRCRKHCNTNSSPLPEE